MRDVYVLIQQTHSDKSFTYDIVGVFESEQMAKHYRDKTAVWYEKSKPDMNYFLMIEKHLFNAKEV